MTVYLLHVFGRLAQHRAGGHPPDPKKPSHYIGYTVFRHAERRVQQHRGGHSGSKYMAQVVREGLRFYLVREWLGAGRDFERRLKSWSQAEKFCPWCKRQQKRARMRAAGQATRPAPLQPRLLRVRRAAA